jgi:hypothetical protein
MFTVLLNSPHRETPKNVTKQIKKKIGFGFLWIFLEKGFRHLLFVNYFCGVFELPLPRNAQAPSAKFTAVAKTKLPGVGPDKPILLP